MQLQNELSRFVVEHQVDDHQREQAASRVVDSIAVAIDAWQGEFMSVVGNALYPDGPIRRDAYFSSADPQQSAFLNGVANHAEDFDDTHRRAGVHASAVVIPTLLALSARSGQSITELLDAAAIGLEVAIRLGIDAGPELNAKGFHATSTLGLFGAVAGAGRLTKMKPADVADALALATSMASGIHQYKQGGGSAKRIHAGLAARSAVSAIQLAVGGVRGGSDAFETKDGFYSSFVGRPPRLSSILDDLGGQWHFNNIQAKRWPVCHHAQSAIDAGMELRPLLQGREIDKVVVYVTKDAVGTICEPREPRLQPTVYTAKFSIYVLVAMILTFGDLEFTNERVQNPQVLDLAGRVGYEILPVDASSGTYPGGLEIHYTTGEVDRRSFENPVLMQAADVVAKATSVSSRAGLDPKWIDRILSGEGTVADLMRELGSDA